MGCNPKMRKGISAMNLAALPKVPLGGAWLAGLHWAKRFLDGSALARCRRGASAVEFALVAPILLTLLTGTVDFGYMLTAQNNLTSVSQETARLVAVGELTLAQAPAYASERIGLARGKCSVSVTKVGSDVVVDITVPYSKVAPIGLLGLFKSGTMSARSTMRIF